MLNTLIKVEMSSPKICKKVAHAFFPTNPHLKASLKTQMDTKNLTYSILSHKVEVQLSAQSSLHLLHFLDQSSTSLANYQHHLYR